MENFHGSLPFPIINGFDNNSILTPIAILNYYDYYVSDVMVVIVLTLCVCLCLLRLHYAPLQWYMGYLCTIRAQYAPPRRNMHHGAQGRLYFLKNSGDPDGSHG